MNPRDPLGDLIYSGQRSKIGIPKRELKSHIETFLKGILASTRLKKHSFISKCQIVPRLSLILD